VRKRMILTSPDIYVRFDIYAFDIYVSIGNSKPRSQASRSSRENIFLLIFDLGNCNRQLLH